MAVPQGAPVERVLQLRKEARPMAVVLDSRRSRLYVSTGRGGTVAVIDSATPQAPRGSAGRDAAVGHRLVAGRALALHRQRPIGRCQRDRYLDAACSSAHSRRTLAVGSGGRARPDREGTQRFQCLREFRIPARSCGTPRPRFPDSAWPSLAPGRSRGRFRRLRRGGPSISRRSKPRRTRRSSGVLAMRSMAHEHWYRFASLPPCLPMHSCTNSTRATVG